MNNQSTKITGSNRLHVRPASSPSPSENDPQETPDPEVEPAEGSSGGYFLEENSGTEDRTPTPEPLELPDMNTAVLNGMAHIPLPGIQLWQEVPWNGSHQGAHPDGLQHQWPLHGHGQGYPPAPGSISSSIYTPSLTDDSDSSSLSGSYLYAPSEGTQSLSPLSSNTPEPSWTGSSWTSDVQSSMNSPPVTSRSNSCSSVISLLSSSSSSWTRSSSSVSTDVQSPQSQDDRLRYPRSHSPHSSSLLTVPQLLFSAGKRLISYAKESPDSWSSPAGASSPTTLFTASGWSSPGQGARSWAPSPSPSSPAMDVDPAFHQQLEDDTDESMSEKSLLPTLEVWSSSSSSSSSSLLSLSRPMQGGFGASVNAQAPVLPIQGPLHRRCSACSYFGPRFSHDHPCISCGENFARRGELNYHAAVGRFRCDWQGCRTSFQNHINLSHHRRTHMSDQNRDHRMLISSLTEPALSFEERIAEHEEEQEDEYDH